MKTLQDVCKQLEPTFQSSIDACRFDGNVGREVINYKTFEKIMLQDGYILTEKTAKGKWKLLVANGILTEISNTRAFVEIAMLCKALGYAVPPSAEGEKKSINFFEEATS